MSTVVVVGASGFVGSAVAAAAEQAGHTVVRLVAPRLATQDPRGHEARRAAGALVTAITGADVVVNCAGNPDASSADVVALRAANATLPAVVGAAASQAGVPRFVHVSSAVVQGRRPVLDDTDDHDAFSPYARSKADGEVAARAHGPAATVVYRPPSVHGPGRRVTRQLSRIAASPLSTVARPGTRPTPQTHIVDVADALVFLATSDVTAPPVVHHPWQGHTTAGLLRLLGCREPTELPEALARTVLATGAVLSRLVPRVGPYARRVEMIWFGQEQTPSWLTERGWRPVTTDEDWARLGRDARRSHDPARTRPRSEDTA